MTEVDFSPSSSPYNHQAKSFSPVLYDISPVMPADFSNFSIADVSLFPDQSIAQEQYIPDFSSLDTDALIQSLSIPANILSEKPAAEQMLEQNQLSYAISHGTSANATENAQPTTNSSSANANNASSHKTAQTGSKTANASKRSNARSTSSSINSRKRVSSDSEHDDVDDVTIKRRRNTEAARRSRQRKLEKMESLEVRVKELEAENSTLSVRAAVLENQKIAWMAKEQELLERTKRLEEQLLESHHAMVSLGIRSGNS
ncbi:hypothetical protein HK096_006067 [Nowakowskiella sp. JEL0078]|nr:hypothetical protein HK096_006067 [Nowakowskiella sp. JEL0078]